MGLSSFWKALPLAIRTWGPISLIVLAEPVSSTLLLPFVYFLVRSFGYDEKDVGSRAGWITSAFFLAQAPAIPAWCLVSDRFGRKPVLLMGLLGTSLSLVLFGMSRSLVWAILARAFGGMVNGNGAVGRTLIVELAKQKGVPTSQAFASVGICTSLGFVVGPLIGGLYTSPDHTKSRSTMTFSEHYPFLLPCLVGAFFNITVFLVSLFGLPETKRAIQTARDGHEPEREPLLSQVNSSEGVQEHSSGPPLVTPSRTTTKICLLLSAACFFLHCIMFDELLPLFASLSAGTGAGLSFRPRDTAAALSSAGPAMLAGLVYYPLLQRRSSSLGLWRLAAGAFALLYPLYSLIPKLNQSDPAGKWAALLTLMVLRYGTLVIAYTSITVLINEVVKDNERALFNGLTQSVGSLARTVGPTVAGTLWSWSIKNGLPAPFDFHFVFLLLAAISLFQCFSTLTVASTPKEM